MPPGSWASQFKTCFFVRTSSHLFWVFSKSLKRHLRRNRFDTKCIKRANRIMPNVFPHPMTQGFKPLSQVSVSFIKFIPDLHHNSTEIFIHQRSVIPQPALPISATDIDVQHTRWFHRIYGLHGTFRSYIQHFLFAPCPTPPPCRSATIIPPHRIGSPAGGFSSDNGLEEGSRSKKHQYSPKLRGGFIGMATNSVDDCQKTMPYRDGQRRPSGDHALKFRWNASGMFA